MKSGDKQFWAAVATVVYIGMVVGTLMLWLGAWVAKEVL